MASSEYEAVLASLYALEAAKGMDFKLERVALALKNLGNPQQQFASVHVAGTNGKGSVAAMLHAMFSAGGWRVGLYTSPHLVSFTERIRVGATEISEDEVVALTHAIRDAASVRGIDLTFFEFVTVMAFLHFARRGVELAVVEVGLGGRLDATNVVDPEVAVITTIALDHQEYLGDTLESVAREKAGIIKPGHPVIVGRVPTAVRHVFAHTAERNGAPVHWVETGNVPDDVVVRLHGAYQRENAATALATVMSLRPKFPIADAAIRRGLAEVQWPGRLDVVQTTPLVILDGAHNTDGVESLVRELPAITGGRPLHALFGVMRDKQWQPMVETLAPHVRSAMLTTVLPPRGEAVDRLAAAFERYCAVRTAADPVAGLEALLQSVGTDEAILVAGSLFLIGAVYPYFLRRRGQLGLFDTLSAATQP